MVELTLALPPSLPKIPSYLPLDVPKEEPEWQQGGDPDPGQELSWIMEDSQTLAPNAQM